MDPTKQEEDVTTQTSSSGSGSIVSGLSLLENDTATDDFGREILAHARADQKRLQQAIQGDGLRAFRKARPLSQRKSVTVENFERKTRAEPNEGLASTEPPESLFHNPRHQRSVSESQSLDLPNVPRKWGSKGIQRNSFLRRLSSFSPPSKEKDEVKPIDPDTIYRRRTVLTGDFPQADTDYLSAAADVPLPTTQRSSPLLRPKTHDGSSIHSVMSSSLDHILKMEHIGELGSSPTRARTRIAKSLSKSEPDLGHYGDVNLYRTSRDFADSRNDQGATVAFDNSKPAYIISPHQQQKTPASRDLLKRLARAASSTPSPPARESLEKIAKAGSFLGSKPRESKKEKTSTLNDQRLPTPPEDSPGPVPSTSHVPKTPVVTGAWIDTPLTRKTSNETGTSEKASEVEVAPASEVVKPPQRHAQSALEAVLRDAQKSTNDEDMYNESTINSLKELLDQDLDLSTVIPFDDETMALVQNVDVPLSHAQHERRQEILALQRMSERLRSARSGLRDASRGMKRVEHEVEGMDQSHKSKVCQKCGCPRGGVTLSGLVVEAFQDFAGKFIVFPKKGGRPRLTMIGWATCLVIAWFVTEFSLLMYYNPPYYTHSLAEYILMVLDDYDYDDRPHLPFLTTSTVLQPHNWDLMYIAKALYWICWRLYRHARYHFFQSIGRGEQEAAALTPAALALWAKLFEPLDEHFLPIPEIGIGQDDFM